MTERADAGRSDGDPGELNRGLGQQRVGEALPAPRQAPALAPAAGGPGAASGSPEPVDDATPLRSPP
jgi:hypothetical protein